MGEIKKFNSVSAGWNEYECKEEGCLVSFYDEDDRGNESNTMTIQLTPGQVDLMYKMMSKVKQDIISFGEAIVE